MAYKEDMVIPSSKHGNLMGTFWSMMMELETQADNENNTLSKHFVEGYFRQWNDLCDDDKVPVWIRRSNKIKQATIC
jgi:hypothetical protein